MGACTLHKPHTLPVLCVLLCPIIDEASWVHIRVLQELCTATAVHHRLAQGWANAHNTKVGQLLRFLSNGSDRPTITCDRPIIHNFRTLA